MTHQAVIDRINIMISEDYKYDKHDFTGADLEALSLAKEALDIVDEQYNLGYKKAIEEFSEHLIQSFNPSVQYTTLRIKEMIKEKAEIWAD